jgi:hypothetical protein
MRLSQCIACWVAGVALPLAIATSAQADKAVDLKLVLAVDASYSMDASEQRMQRQGYVQAFRHPEVIDAIEAGGSRIVVAYVEWAGTHYQKLRVPWTLIDDKISAQAFAAEIEALPLVRMGGGTSISGALLFSAGLFNGSGFRGLRHVIDISGDGPNNSGAPVHLVRDLLVAQGIVINGLPIMIEGSTQGGWPGFTRLDTYCEDCVIGGPGAFSLPVRDVEELSAAIRRKLVLEIAVEPLHPYPAGFGGQAFRSDCLLGEAMWNRLS